MTPIDSFGKALNDECPAVQLSAIMMLKTTLMDQYVNVFLSNSSRLAHAH